MSTTRIDPSRASRSTRDLLRDLDVADEPALLRLADEALTRLLDLIEVSPAVEGQVKAQLVTLLEQRFDLQATGDCTECLERAPIVWRPPHAFVCRPCSRKPGVHG